MCALQGDNGADRAKGLVTAGGKGRKDARQGGRVVSLERHSPSPSSSPFAITRAAAVDLGWWLRKERVAVPCI